MAKVYAGTESVVAHLEGVVLAVEAQGVEIHNKAARLLAEHRDDGDSEHHRIESEKHLDKKYGPLDYEISLVGPAPMSLEFGHFLHNAAFPRYVVGLYILHRAAGLI